MHPAHCHQVWQPPVTQRGLCYGVQCGQLSVHSAPDTQHAPASSKSATHAHHLEHVRFPGTRCGPSCSVKRGHNVCTPSPEAVRPLARGVARARGGPRRRVSTTLHWAASASRTAAVLRRARVPRRSSDPPCMSPRNTFFHPGQSGEGQSGRPGPLLGHPHGLAYIRGSCVARFRGRPGPSDSPPCGMRLS